MLPLILFLQLQDELLHSSGGMVGSGIAVGVSTVAGDDEDVGVGRVAVGITGGSGENITFMCKELKGISVFLH